MKGTKVANSVAEVVDSLLGDEGFNEISGANFQFLFSVSLGFRLEGLVVVVVHFNFEAGLFIDGFRKEVYVSLEVSQQVELFVFFLQAVLDVVLLFIKESIGQGRLGDFNGDFFIDLVKLEVHVLDLLEVDLLVLYDAHEFVGDSEALEGELGASFKFQNVIDEIYSIREGGLIFELSFS